MMAIPLGGDLSYSTDKRAAMRMDGMDVLSFLRLSSFQ